jgi:hemerythrin
MLRWSDAFQSNSSTLDEEHAELFRLLNRLESLEHPERKVDPEEFQRNVDELLEYTTAHCNREERVMLAVGYPGSREHALEHRKLRDQLLAIVPPAARDLASIPAFSKAARSLLLQHFQKEDLAYLRWIGERPGQPLADPSL